MNRPRRKLAPATIGLRVKSGRAIAVGLTGSRRVPQAFDSSIVTLSDRNIPETMQPYHARYGTLEEDQREIRRRVRIVEKVTARSVSALFSTYKSKGFNIRRAALVVGSVIDPDTIGNQHIRAHALEGLLFRTVLEKHLRTRHINVITIVERNLLQKAIAHLNRPAGSLMRALVALRPLPKGSWRAEQKMATLAAWITLR